MVYIIAIIIIIVLAFSLLLVKGGKEEDFSISFMETFNLTEMPIVTFLAGNTKINFLLDTGSSQSYIAQTASNLVTGKEMICNIDVISAQGTEDLTCKVIDTTLTYKNKEFEVRLFVNKSLNISFSDLKDKKGITLHGILGSDFLDKYSYIIDFKKYLAYPKK